MSQTESEAWLEQSPDGAGQFEINMRRKADPLRAADDAVLFKRLVHGVARRHWLAATFMAKPYGDLFGSGFHTHFSLLDKNGVSVFDNGGDDGTPMMFQRRANARCRSSVNLPGM